MEECESATAKLQQSLRAAQEALAHSQASLHPEAVAAPQVRQPSAGNRAWHAHSLRPHRWGTLPRRQLGLSPGCVSRSSGAAHVTRLRLRTAC